MDGANMTITAVFTTSVTPQDLDLEEASKEITKVQNKVSSSLVGDSRMLLWVIL